MKKYLLPVALLFLLSLSTNLVFGQATIGAIYGDVFDAQTKQPIPGAKAVVTHTEMNISKEAITDAHGYWIRNNLHLGTYSVIVKKEGYSDPEPVSIRVIAEEPRVSVPPFYLSPMGSPPIPTEPPRELPIDTIDTAQRATFDEHATTGLPLSGIRTPDDLALLATGVLPPPASSGKGPGVGPGVGTSGQFSVNGQRSRSNNFTIDGSDNNDEDIGVRRQGFVSLTPQSVDSIKNFQIRYGVYSAEFGRNSGSVVDLVSKSGGNDIHGSVFGFLTNHRLNARDFFSTRFRDTVNTGGTTRLGFRTSSRNNGGSSSSIDPFTRAQFGFAAGGPIVKDKTFFFGSFERQQIRQSVQAHFAVPPEEHRGFVSCVRLDGSEFCRLGQAMPGTPRPDPDSDPDPRRQRGRAGRAVLSLYPFPNNLGGPFGPFTYTKRLPANANGNIFSVKLDHKIGERNLFTARYNFTDDDSIIPTTGGSINSSLKPEVRTQNISLIWTQDISPRITNLARFSFGRTRLRFLPREDSPFLFQDEQNLTGPIGQLLIAPFSPVGVDVFNFDQRRVNNTFQVGDTFSFQVGGHNLKAGLDIRRSQLNSLLDRNFRPLVTFLGTPVGTVPTETIEITDLPPGNRDFSTRYLHGLDIAALGVPTGILQTLSLVPDSTLGLRFSAFNFFFHDNWRIHPKVTIDWGIRYEINTVPTEAHDRIKRALTSPLAQIPPVAPNFSDPSDYVSTFNQTRDAYINFLGGRTRLYNLDLNNFAPRFGIAWRLNDRTVLRGGYGIFYDQIIGSVTSQSRNVFPNTIPVNFVPGLPNDISTLGRDFSGNRLANPALLTFQRNPLLVRDPANSNRFRFLPSAPNLFIPVLGRLFGAGVQISNRGGIAFTLPDQDLRTPYAQHYNLIFERELFTGTALSLGYVGSRGVKLTRFRTPNGGINYRLNIEKDDTGQITIRDATAPRPRFRKLQNLGAFTIFEDTASSNFNSLQVGINRRFSSSLQFTSSYTYSHTIDDVSDVFDGVGFFVLPQDDNNLRAERASASFDVRHRLAISYLWELPVFKQNKILGGWRIAGINTFQTGQPFTVNTGIDVNLDGNLNDRLNSTAGLTTRSDGRQRILGAPRPITDRDLLDRFIAPTTQSGRVGRNTFRAAGIATVDFSVMKDFKMTEDKSIEFRSEFFNLFNRTHFGIPVRILESPGFGSSVNTLLRPRFVQFALKFKF